MNRTQAASCAFVLLVGPFTPRASAQVQVTTLASPTDSAYSNFGASLDQGAQRVIVGSNDERAFVYRRDASGWSLEAELTSPDPHDFDEFGARVALDGEWAAVSARFDDTAALDAGAVYLYRRDGTTWSLDQVLVASAPKPGDRFGQAMALESGRLIVGAPGDPDGGEEAGNAYVFEFLGFGWLQLAELAVAPDAFARYGGAVAIDGDWAIVGADGDGEAAPAAGAAHVWRRTPTGWVHSGKLIASDAGALHGFGASVAVSGARAAVGAPKEDSLGTLSGAVYLYSLGASGAEFEAKVVGRPDSLFGSSIALSGDDMWTGATRSDGPLAHSGAVLHHRRGPAGWGEVSELWAGDGRSNDFFGAALALDGERLLVAGPLHEGVNPDAGRVYEFDLGSFAVSYCDCAGEAPCANPATGSGCANSSGQGARLAWSGSSSSVQDDLVLSVTGAPAGVFGLACAGRLRGRTPLADGLLCLDPAGGLQRLPLQVSDAGGGFTFGPGIVERSQAWSGSPIAPGTTWNFQCWFRDPVGPCGAGSNLSNAAAVAFSL